MKLLSVGLVSALGKVELSLSMRGILMIVAISHILLFSPTGLPLCHWQCLLQRQYT